jgi:4-hydroxybenzoate polyprenyltransferase
VNFTALRFGLLALLTVILMFVVPLIIALTIAIILQLPLAMMLFGRQRQELNAALADARAGRRAERAELRAALHGDER